MTTDSHVVAQEAVGPQRIPPERLHDQEVVQLVPLLRIMDFPELRPAPPAEGLVEVQHAYVREVGNPRDHLQEPEPLDGPLVEERVQEQAPHIIQLARHGMRVDAAARRLAFPLGFRHGLVRQDEAQRRGHGARVALLEPDTFGHLS